MTGVQVEDFPGDPTPIDKQLLCKWGESLILKGMEIDTAPIVRLILVMNRPGRGVERYQRLTINLVRGFGGEGFGDIGVKDCLGIDDIDESRALLRRRLGHSSTAFISSWAGFAHVRSLPRRVVATYHLYQSISVLRDERRLVDKSQDPSLKSFRTTFSL